MTTSGTLSRRAFLRLAAGAGALGLGALTSGCGALQALAPTPTAVPITTITIWNWIDESLASLVEDFEQREPTIKVQLEQTSYGQAQGGIMRALESGEGAPDVFIAELAWMGALRSQAGLADLGAAPFDAAALKGDFLPWTWELAAYEGRLVALPWVVGVGAAWYRADVLEAAGLPASPEAVAAQAPSWDGWIALDEALRRASPEAALIPETLRLFQPAVAQQGLGWVDGERLLVEEKGVRAAELLARLYERDIPADLPGGEYGQRMVQGSYAGMVDGSWMQLFLQRDFQTTAGKWRITRAPGGDYAAGAIFLCIPQQSRAQEAAWTFVRALCASAEGQNTTFKATGALPAYTPAWSDPLYDRGVEFFGGQPAYRLLTEAATNIPLATLSPFDQQIDQIVFPQAQRVARGDKTAAEAMADAAASVRQQIPELKG
jgi:ABC-type glycerol-3-phosphate transport system substrate-binding protein